LISPPGSPPVGWEPIKEDPPNATPLADDLIAALRKLQVHRKNSSREMLLEPEDGVGVTVYVEQCGGDEEEEEEEEDHNDEDWVYGQPSPMMQRWTPIRTSLPPISMEA
jgi:calcipressin-2